jgi:hypothetical protein
MNSLIPNLDDHDDLLRSEVWPYLTIKDICNLLTVNKNIKEISLSINILYSHTISLCILHRSLFEKNIILNNMLKSFPKIVNLIITKRGTNTHPSIVNYAMTSDTMSILYNKQSICNSLQNFQVILADSGCVGLPNFDNVRKLNVSYSTITSIVVIATMINITSLKIIACKNITTDEGLLPIMMLTNLTYLNMSYCIVSNIRLQYVSNLTNLVSLDLSWCEGIDDDGTTHLSSLINLTYLNLTHSGISNLLFLTPLIQMTRLNLSRCVFLREKNVFSPISNLTNLTSLDLSDPVEPRRYCRSIDCLSNLTNLISLNLKGVHLVSTSSSLSPLNSLVNLEYLNLMMCLGIRNVDLMETISYLTNLKHLYLNGVYNLKTTTRDYLMTLDHIKVLHEEKFCNFTTSFNNI